MALYLDRLISSLPSNTKSYPYKGLEDLRSRVEQSQYQDNGMRSEYVLFTGVDKQSFDHGFEDTQDKSTYRLLDSYFPQSQTLLIIMPSSEHEMGHLNLTRVLFLKLSAMGDATLALKPTGAKDYQTSTRTKRADESFKPKDLPPGRSTVWPSLVIESGWSECKRKLREDASWFLEESAGDVKVALTISIHRDIPEIVINKWVAEANPTSTRSRVQSILDQQIVISKAKGQPTSTATTEGAPLVIPFDDLFLRAPRRGEGAVEFTPKDLRDVADLIWDEQEI